MTHPAILKTFFIGNKAVEIFVPNPDDLVAAYKKQENGATSLYWARVWPAAIGLCNFLNDNLSYIANKRVLELAAGPGLPGIFCAEYAKQVCISDVEPEAVALVERSVAHLQLKNVKCLVIDWNDLATVSIPEVVLLSDINYDPAQFDQLLLAVHFLLDKQCTIILSTPQRLMAKDFINQLLLFCKEQAEVEGETDGVKTIISVFVLKK
jgi:predicted nicotinamide N-methyase